MKKILFLLLAFTLLANCRGQDPDVLPDATQVGKNTGGAIVDGKIWVAKTESPDHSQGGNNTYIMSDKITGREIMTITLRELQNIERNFIVISIESPQALEEGSYPLNEIDGSRAVIKHNLDVFYTDDNTNNGSVTITKLDRTKKIISGTFEFKAKNSAGKVTVVNEGRFDRKYL